MCRYSGNDPQFGVEVLEVSVMDAHSYCYREFGSGMAYFVLRPRITRSQYIG